MSFLCALLVPNRDLQAKVVVNATAMAASSLQMFPVTCNTTLEGCAKGEVVVHGDDFDTCKSTERARRSSGINALEF